MIVMGDSSQRQQSSAPSEIRDMCAQKWATDYSMRAYCEKKQIEAKSVVDARSNGTVPITVFNRIRSQCIQKWGPDYSMRDYCETKETAAYGQVEAIR